MTQNKYRPTISINSCKKSMIKIYWSLFCSLDAVYQIAAKAVSSLDNSSRGGSFSPITDHHLMRGVIYATLYDLLINPSKCFSKGLLFYAVLPTSLFLDKSGYLCWTMMLDWAMFGVWCLFIWSKKLDVWFRLPKYEHIQVHSILEKMMNNLVNLVKAF